MPYIDKGRYYTYGNKTLTELDSLTGMSAGETCFCTTNNRLMTYDGTLWMCCDFVRMTNGSGITLDRGDVVVTQEDVAGNVTTTVVGGDPTVVGVVVFGAANGSDIAIAISGIYDVLTSSSTTPGDYALTDTVATQANSTVTMGDGFFGVFTENNVAAGLTRCWIKPHPEYF